MDIPKTPENKKHPLRPLSPLRSPIYAHHFDPFVFNTHWPDLHSEQGISYKKMLICKDGFFRAALDVHDFEKDEISVKVSGHTIHVDCHHGDREDDFSTVSRKLNRTYVLPPTFDMNLVESTIDTESGILKITVPPPKKDSVERVIEIKHEETPSKST